MEIILLSGTVGPRNNNKLPTIFVQLRHSYYTLPTPIGHEMGQPVAAVG